MLKTTILMSLLSFSFVSNAYEVTYECAPLYHELRGLPSVFVSIVGDNSDRKNKIYHVAVDDSNWMKVDKSPEKNYGNVTLQVPSWGEDSYSIKLHRSVLAGGYKGKVYYKSESSLLPSRLKCFATSKKHLVPEFL